MRFVFLITMLFSVQAFGIGRLQDADFKTVTQLTNAGGSAAQLLNDSKIYVSANGINQQLSTAITSGLIGGGGGVNLVSNGSFEASGVTGWSTFTTTLTGGIPTGTVGTCTGCSLAISANTAAPLNGKASLQLTAASSVTAGQGFISNSFSVPPAYRGQVMTIKGFNSLVSGSPVFAGDSTNTFAVYIYDTTALQWIQPAGVYGLVNSAGPFGTISFQVPPLTSLMRIAIVAVNPLATATTLLFDDLAVSPGINGSGPAVSDWRAGGVNQIGAVTTAPTKGTTAVDQTFYRQVGDSFAFRGEYRQTAAGSAGSGDYLFTLPNNRQFDLTKVTLFTGAVNTSTGAANAQTCLGSVFANDGASLVGCVMPYSATQFRIIGLYAISNSSANRAAVGSAATGSLAGNPVSISYDFTAPIANAAANVTQSSDYDGSSTTFQGNVSSTTSMTANTTLLPLTATVDRAGSWNGTTFTVRTVGDYAINGTLISSAAGDIQAYVNGALRNQIGSNAQAATARIAVSGVLANLKVGDQVTIRSSVNQTITANAADFITLVRAPGSTPVIQASQSVIASYGLNAAQSVAAAGVLKYDARVRDTTGGAYSPTTGLFTAPMNGTYRVSGAFVSNASETVYLKVNGAGATAIGGTKSTLISTAIGGYVVLLQGQTVGVYFDTAASFNGIDATVGYLNQITFERVGF